MKHFTVEEIRDRVNSNRKYGTVIGHEKKYRPLEELERWFEKTHSNHCIMYKRYSSAMANAIDIEDCRINDLAMLTSRALIRLKWLEEDNGNYVCITKTRKDCKLYYMYLDEGFVVFE